MRIWIDITASAHVLVFRPLIERLRERGHDVEVTARDYAQTLQLLELHRVDHVTFGRHGGGSALRKATALAARTAALLRFASKRKFDLALAHGSNDLALAAAALRVPAVNTFDYEWAVQQHQVGCRLAKRVMVPDRIPPERLARYGVGPRKLVQYPGLKEEYYLFDFEPDAGVMHSLGVDQDRVTVVLRPPPDVSMYHRMSNELFPRVLDYLGHQENVHAVVLPRTDEQRQAVRSLRYPSLIVAERAVDAQSLIALADLVVSAGGTMNREAVALGTPVFTTFGGRLGGVDEALMREGRLKPLTSATALELVKRPSSDGQRVRRDPGLLADLVLGAV
jgi:predicted glycosyltransferase